VAGTALGYLSSVLYIMSRVSQIYKNASRHSVEGLSTAMFTCAVCANICTGSGIITRTFDLQQLVQQVPWIVGSLGTVMLDLVILSQARRYSQAKGQGAGGEVQQPLLSGAVEEL
jgi:uncharacterized protein with PQ loop repeat